MNLNPENRKYEEKEYALPEEGITLRELTEWLRKEAERTGAGPLEKARRCPGFDWLRKNGRLIARMPAGDGACEAYGNGYAVYDSGMRKTVVWLPEAGRAARNYSPACYGEPGRRREEEEPEETPEDPDPGEDRPDEEMMQKMPWYLAVVLAGEDALERNRARNRQDGCLREADAPEKAGGKRGGAAWPYSRSPEEEYIRKETEEERAALLTERQKEVYELILEGGLSQREAAARLGVSQKAVACRLEGIVKKLRKIDGRR